MSSNGGGSETVFDASFDDVFVIRAGTGGALEAVFATTPISKGAKIYSDSFVWIVHDPLHLDGETRQQYAERMRAYYVVQWAAVRRNFAVSHPDLEESISKLQPAREPIQLRGEWLEDVLRVNGWLHKTVRNNMPVKSTMLAVYKGSKFNHSCKPSLQTNLTSVQAGVGAGRRVNTNSKDDPREVWVQVLRDIPAGEEATVSYLTPKALLQGVQFRRKKLLEMWGFTCVCERCTAQSAAGESAAEESAPPSTPAKRKNNGGHHGNTEKRSAQHKMAHADHQAIDATPPLTPVLSQMSVTPPMPAILGLPRQIPQLSLLAPIHPVPPAANYVALSLPAAQSAPIPLLDPSSPVHDLLQLVHRSQELNTSVLREAVHSLPVFRTDGTLRAPAAAHTTSVTSVVEPTKTVRTSGRVRVPKVPVDQGADTIQRPRPLVARTGKLQSVGSKHDVRPPLQMNIPTSSSNNGPPSWKGQLWRPANVVDAPVGSVPFCGVGLSFLATLCAETAAREKPPPPPPPVPPRLDNGKGKATSQNTQQCPLRDFLTFVLSERMRKMMQFDKTRMMLLSVLLRLVQHFDQYESTRGAKALDLDLLNSAHQVAFQFYSEFVDCVRKDREKYITPLPFKESRIKRGLNVDYIAEARLGFFGDALVSRAMLDIVCFFTRNIPKMRFGGAVRMQHDLQWWHTTLEREMLRYASNSFTPEEAHTKNGRVYCYLRMLFCACAHPSVLNADAIVASATLCNGGAGST